VDAVTDIDQLLIAVAPLGPDTRIEEAGDIFLQPGYEKSLSLAVVDEQGQTVGSVSRSQLNDVFLRRYGRELLGRHPVTEIMSLAPLTVDRTQSLEQAAEALVRTVAAPITEDFVITADGRYRGMGSALDLLAGMQRRLSDSAVKLQGAYRRLQSSQAALVQNEKMASLGQMVAGVAHEINTPLGYVRNNVEMLEQTLEQVDGVFRIGLEALSLLADEQADEALLTERLTQATQELGAFEEAQMLPETRTLITDTLFGIDQIRDLVVNLRSFSRLDQARVDEVNLNDALEQTLVIANAVIKGRVEVIRRFAELPAISCSPSQINQVLLNLITNAAQAVPETGGKLLLKTEFDEAQVHVSVQDNGRGIAPENLKKIFDPFFTTKPVGEGTGLGLSISHQIVQAHGGRIDVVSQPGRGTRFRVSLPRRMVEAEAA
jgi:two-component system NtrC family sensor kinase